MAESDKPVGAKIGWSVLETNYPFSTPWMRLRQDRVRITGKGDTTYTYHDHPGSVVIVPVTPEGDIVLIRQYRYPVDAWCLEVPAGGVTSLDGKQSLEDVAHAELEEEIGAHAEEMQHVASYYPANSLSNEVCHVFLALSVQIVQQQRLDLTEFIEVIPTPALQAVSAARKGEIEDGFSALAILMCEEILRERGFLTSAS